jgi:tetratricopeptide (TPR) repeat protein
MSRPCSAALLILSCGAALGPAARADPPSPKNSAADANLPAQVERLVVRDVLQADGSTSRTIEGRVLLRDAVGVSQFGQIGAPYMQDLGDVSFEDVVIEKPEGRRVEVKGGATEDLNPLGTSQMPIPSDFRIRRLTVPGLAPGDRLSYRVITRHKPLFPDLVFGEFKFASGPAITEQVYELDMPAGLRLSVRRRPDVGPEWEDVPSAPGRRVRRMAVLAPIPLPEAVTAAEALAEPDVLYTSFSSWDQMARWWWALSKDRFAPDATVRAEAGRVLAGKDDVRARIAALHAFVSGQIRYLNVGFGSGRFQPQPAADVLSSRYGDCKGKHALLAALGSPAGIEVWPVLIHSARKDIHDDVPSPAQFDHLISVVRLGNDPSQWVWLDGTNDFAPAGHLAPSLRGKRALVVDDKGGHLVTIPERPPFVTRLLVEGHDTLEAAGPLRAHVRWTVRGDSEPLLRAAVRLLPRDKWKELGKQMAKEWSKGVVGEVNAGDPIDLDQAFWVEYDVEHKMTSKTFEKDWTLWVPLPDPNLPEAKEEKTGEPAAELRMEDEVVLRARVEMPQGMKARAPLSVTLDRPFASYRSTYSVEGRTLVVERILQVKQRKIGADQAAAYNAFRSAVNADGEQQFAIEAFHAAAPEALETADALNDAGKAALDQAGDAARAATLLRQAVEKDPKHKWAWNNLGRALRKLKKPEEALTAFTRQIEANPFDAYAYDNRGATLLFDLDRRDESERDFLKQIEVTPLEPHAYRDLAYLRTLQKRFPEAAELLERADAARPADAQVLMKLAWARARARIGDTAAAVARARAKDDSPRTTIIGARALAVAGDLPAAAALAAEALPRLNASLASQGAPGWDDEDSPREVLYLAEGWRLVGAAAFAAGDMEKAERYLSAAWEMGATPDAAADLGRLRERQGRASEAVRIWQQASMLQYWLGNPATKELERAVADAGRRAELLESASRAMFERHVQRLPGPAPATTFHLRLILLVDERGRILEARAQEPADEARLKPLRDRVLAARLPAATPDESAFKLLRDAGLICHPPEGCSLALDLYGDEVARVLER